MRAVFDPNVLISAVISDRGAPRELLDRWERGEFELIVSAELLFELREVLARPKFRRSLTEAEVTYFVSTTERRRSPRNFLSTLSGA